MRSTTTSTNATTIDRLTMAIVTTLWMMMILLLGASSCDAAASSTATTTMQSLTPSSASASGAAAATAAALPSLPRRRRNLRSASAATAAMAADRVQQCLDAHGDPLPLHVHDNNHHLYAYVTSMTYESWHDADQAASELTCCHTKGRLLVVNDESEQNFVQSTVIVNSESSGWMAIVDDVNDGVWKSQRSTDPDSGEPASTTTETAVNPDDGDGEGCGTESTYDDKDYQYGVRCRQTVHLPILVEFECPPSP